MYLYVQTRAEDTNRIKLSIQRHLINNFKMATEMGAEVIQIKSNNVPDSIVKIAEERTDHHDLYGVASYSDYGRW